MLTAAGFRLDDHEPLALSSASKDLTVVVVPLVSNKPGQFANVAYIRKGNGSARAETAIFTVDSKGKMDVTEAFRTTGSKTDRVSVQSSYWDCMWRCALTVCGPGCVACGFAGPAWWKCCLAICGTGVLVCLIVCA